MRNSEMAKKTPRTKAKGRKSAGARKTAKAKRKTGRKPAGARTAKGKARKSAAAGSARKRARAATVRSSTRRRGGTGREDLLAQTPDAGRTRKGPTNRMPTKRSTGTRAGAGHSMAPGLNRRRRQLREIEEGVPTPPSSLDMDRTPSAARSGRRELREARQEHTEVSPVITAGDVDASWEDAYSVGDEAPGGDNPTPDQDRVEDIGRALGVSYQDNEELKPADKIAERDRKRWELDPASSEDYRDRD
jgi:hypothetical protein